MADKTRAAGRRSQEEKIDDAVALARSHSKRAFVLGINTYGPEIPALTTPVADANAMCLALEGMGYADVGRCIESEEFKPTKEEIERWLERIQEAASSENVRMVVYYAGHGVALEVADAESQGKLEGYLIPSGATVETSTWVPMSKLYEAICGGSKAKGPQHLLLILDCCFAGVIRWSEGRRNSSPRRTTLSPELFEYFLRQKAAWALTSSSHDQEALDLDPSRRRGEDRTPGHSPFAAALLDLFRGQDAEGKAISDETLESLRADGILTVTEIIHYVKKRFLALCTKGNSKHLQTPGLWPLGFHGSGDYCFELSATPVFAEACALTKDANPWMGLESYVYVEQESKRRPFIGREVDSKELASYFLREEPLPLAVVTGPSGCGKSSLVNAGLLPRLKSNGWIVLPPNSPRDLTGEKLREAQTKVYNVRTIWVIDQLEEAYTSATKMENDKKFTVELGRLMQDPPNNLHILVTVREDYEADVRELLQLNEVWPRRPGRFVPSTLSRADLKEIVARPAQERSIFFEDSEDTQESKYSIVDLLVDDTAEGPGALPLLSHALSELFQRLVDNRERNPELRTITLADYRSMDGVRGSLRNSADHVYTKVLKTPLEKDMMINVLVRMITMTGGEPTRRRVYREELEFASDELQKARKAVIDALEDRRLIVAATDPVGTYHQPAHEELLRSWSPLREWTQGEKLGDLLLLRKVTHQAQAWSKEPADSKATRLWEREPELNLALSRFGINGSK